MTILGSGSDAVISYEKNVLGKEKIKECYYSVAFTEKGAQHVMNLHNGWQEKIGHFNGKRLNFRHGYKNPRPHFCNRSTLIIHI